MEKDVDRVWLHCIAEWSVHEMCCIDRIILCLLRSLLFYCRHVHYIVKELLHVRM